MDSEQSEAESAGRSSGAGRLITIAILVVLLIVAAVFGFWAFSQMQDYKNNSDKKTALAVAQAEANQKVELQAQFDEQSKSPTKTFKGSPTYGSITFNYPKTWSVYIDSSDTSQPIDGYFHPDVVPGTASKTAFALRVELVTTDYAQVLQNFDSDIKQGKVTARAYVPPKLQGTANVTAGTYLSGQINRQDDSQNGNMVVMKVRDKTLQIYSESPNFASDFNNIVLASLTFVP